MVCDDKAVVSWSAVAQLLECRTRNRESPGSNPRCYRFEVWAFSFTSRRLSRLRRNGVRITDSSNRLITIGSLTDGDHTLNCSVRVPSGSPQCSGNLPHVRAEGESNVASKTNACLVAGVSADLWHRRFGHLGEQNMNKSVKSDLVKNTAVSKQEMIFFEPCVIRSANILDLIHSDVSGPLKPQSLGGKGYFVTFADDCSRFVCVRFIRDKSEVFRKFRDLVKVLEKGTGRKIKALRSDRGGEYLSGEFQQYLKRLGIDHQLTRYTADSPEQNGVAERMNREIVEKSRAMMAAANIPNTFWAEAIANAA